MTSICGQKKRIWESLAPDYTHNLISKTLRGACTQFCDIFEERKKTADKDDVQNIQVKIDMCKRLYVLVGDNPLLVRIFKELKRKIYNPEFLKLLDNSESNFHFFPFGDKVVDLRTGELSDRLKEHYFTYSVAFLPDKDPVNLKVVDDFMRQMCRGLDAEQLHLVRQEIYGYCLSGYRPEKELLINLGSTIHTIMSYVMGKAFITNSDDLIVKKPYKSSGPAPQLLALIGKRFAVFNELLPGSELNEGTIKSITSNLDEQTGRGMYQKKMVNFHVYAAFALTSNFVPKVSVYDDALSGPNGRIKIIPCKTRFTDKIVNEEVDVLKDQNLVDSMCGKRYLPSVIQWCINGAVRWYKNKCKIQYPSVCEMARQEMVMDIDISGPDPSMFPKTHENKIQKIECFSNIKKFYYNCLVTGVISLKRQCKLTGNVFNDGKFGEELDKEEIYEAYIDEFSEKTPKNMFWKEIYKISEREPDTRPTILGKGRRYCVTFKSQEDCKKKFCDVVKDSTFFSVK